MDFTYRSQLSRYYDDDRDSDVFDGFPEAQPRPRVVGQIAEFYTLAADGRRPQPEADPQKWHRWMSHSQLRVLRQETLPDGTFISTVFMGVEHGVRLGEPHVMLWQTAVFSQTEPVADVFYGTYAAALAGHEAIVTRLRGGRAIRLREDV